MVCRLCLEESAKYFPIFNPNDEVVESEIAKLVVKYLHMELLHDDEVSDKICKDCWEQLQSFHTFQLHIEQKQEELKLRLRLTTAVCGAREKNEDVLMEDYIDEGPLPLDIVIAAVDVRNAPAGETQINAVNEENLTTEFKEFQAADLSSPRYHEELFVADAVRGKKKLAQIAQRKTPNRKAKNSQPPLDTADLDTQPLPLYEQPIADHSIDELLSPARAEFDAADLSENSNQACSRRKSQNRKAGESLQRASLRVTEKRMIASKMKKQNKVNNKMEKEAKNAALIRELDAYIAKHSALSCCICRQQLQDFNMLKKHFRQQHQCVGYVVCCDNRFLKRTLYVDHLKLHENPEYFKCEKCNKILASRGCYYNHMVTLHPPEEELKFQCEFCARKFAKQYILDYHLTSHKHDKNEHMCLECNKGFRTANALKAHHQRMHLNATVTICDICGKNFRSNQSLQMHKASVHQGVQLPEAQCHICQKWLKDSRSLYKHMYKHQDEESGKEFMCPQCGEVKSSRHSLSSHIRYHHSEQAFNCTLCGKVFKRRRSLEEHMATHTGKDLYTCAFCPQKFKSHANMHNHKKKMHPNEWVRKYTQPTATVAAQNV